MTALALRDVGMTFHQPDGVELEVLRAFQLMVEPSESVAIVGASGSGKSTMLSIAGLLTNPTTGHVEVGGVCVSSDAAERSRVRGQEIGFIFQAFHLLDHLSALENVAEGLRFSAVPARERRRRASEALALVGLTERLEHRPSRMSGGEQQRVAIARAMVKEPTVVLADEPTGNLDAATSGKIVAHLKELTLRSALVLVTHDPSVAATADRIVEIGP